MLIDTLSIARDLKATELPPAQAEAIAAAIGHSINETAASKADLVALEQRLNARFDALDGQLGARIEAVKSALLMWVAGAIFASAGLIIATLKL